MGHALVAALEKHSQPVSKITIVPHTSGALGYTMHMPEEEKYLSRGGRNYIDIPGDGIWRCYNYLAGTHTYDVVENLSLIHI